MHAVEPVVDVGLRIAGAVFDAVDMLARLTRGDGDQRVLMVGRGDQPAIHVWAVEYAAIVLEKVTAIDALGDLFRPRAVDVAGRDDPCARGQSAGQIVIAPAAAADDRHADTTVGFRSDLARQGAASNPRDRQRADGAVAQHSAPSDWG